MPRTAAVLGVAVLALAGCGRGEDPPPSVTGRVLYRGAPLAGGTIVFEPDPGRGGDGPMVFGEVGPDGRYALRAGTGGGVGAGWHRVTFAAAHGTALPPRYSDPTRSGQVCEVKAGRENEIDFDLK